MTSSIIWMITWTWGVTGVMILGLLWGHPPKTARGEVILLFLLGPLVWLIVVVRITYNTMIEWDD